MSVLSVPPWMRPEYPFITYTFRAERGAQLSYLDEGPRGETAVLMLHGNPTWSYYYRDLVRDLRGSARCIVPDHIGMGLSEKPLDYEYTLERRIADIEALILHLGVKRIRLVVHDWGGAIGFGLATRHPEWIERIVILNTAAFLSDRIPLRISVCRWPGIGALLVRGLNGFAGPATQMAMHRRALTPEQKRAYLFPYDSWGTRIAVHQFVRDIPRSETHPSYATLEAIERRLPSLEAIPKRIIWGGQDFCFDHNFLVRWKEIYPGASCIQLADAGHYVLEDAGDEVRASVIDFFR